MFEYTGVIHIHSVFSDGSGEVKNIMQDAQEVGVDFLILTDHNTLRAMQEGFEGWYGNTALLVGCEINDKLNQNHLLALGIKETISTRLPALEYTRKVKDAGGISFIAHPHEKRSSMKEHPPYPWNEWRSEDFTGIEIWNHMSEWMEGLTEQNKYNYFIHPLRSIIGPSKETLEVWDSLNQKRRVVGIGGVDAHAHKVNLLGFFEMEVFPYKVLFKSVRTHVLTSKELKSSTKPNDFENAKKQIYDSLKEGRCFVSNSYYGEAKGFAFYADLDSNTFQMGETIPFTQNIRLVVKSPNPEGQIRLICNGKIVNKKEGQTAEFKIKEKGAYRVEIFVEDNAWIFSNHIRIGL